MEGKKTTQEEYQKCVNAVVDYINLHLGEEIDLKSLARISHFSPFYFHRIMKAFLHEPLGAFIVRTRIETAARLLRYSSMSVSDIAYQIGYGSPSSLSKIFKQFYGISPNEYRNNKDHVIMKPLEINPALDVTMEVREQQPKQVIYVRLTGAYMALAYCEAWKKLYAYVSEEKIDTRYMEYICIYHDDPKVTEPKNLRTDVCFTVPSPAQPRGEIGVKEIPGGKYLIFLYKGPYANLGAVYDTIYGHWIPQGGYTVSNSRGYESYLNSPESTPPEELLTEICIPVE